METLTKWIQKTTKLSPELQVNIFTSIIIILVLWFLRFLIIKIVQRQNKDAHVLYRWQKISAYVTAVLGIFLVGRVWFEGLQAISTFLGLLSAGLAIALRDFVVNFVCWIFILVRRPFRVGDRIQIGDYAGDVIDIRIFEFTLLEIGNWVDADQSTGRIIHVPNGKVISDVLANYSRGFRYIWNEIPVLITFESDWKKAKEILQKIADKKTAHLSESAERRIRKASRKFLIFYKNLTPTVYTSVEGSGVLLTIRCLCEPRKRRMIAEAIWEDILQEFDKCVDIDFAYPTQRFYNNILEGKTGNNSSQRQTNGDNPAKTGV